MAIGTRLTGRVALAQAWPRDDGSTTVTITPVPHLTHRDCCGAPQLLETGRVDRLLERPEGHAFRRDSRHRRSAATLRELSEKRPATPSSHMPRRAETPAAGGRECTAGTQHSASPKTDRQGHSPPTSVDVRSRQCLRDRLAGLPQPAVPVQPAPGRRTTTAIEARSPRLPPASGRIQPQAPLARSAWSRHRPTRRARVDELAKLLRTARAKRLAQARGRGPVSRDRRVVEAGAPSSGRVASAGVAARTPRRPPVRVHAADHRINAAGPRPRGRIVGDQLQRAVLTGVHTSGASVRPGHPG